MSKKALSRQGGTTHPLVAFGQYNGGSHAGTAIRRGDQAAPGAGAGAERAVKVLVLGKHFPALQPSEQKVLDYEGTAVEFKERHTFARHAKAWGAAHTGPGIRFLCVSDAIDDPDHKVFWTTLALWNRWRHDTYKDNRDAELQFLDQLPSANVAVPQPKKKEKEEPEVKKHFELVAVGTHTYAGTGLMSGRQANLEGVHLG